MAKKTNSTLKILVPLIIVVLIIGSVIGGYLFLKSKGFDLFNLNLMVNNQTIINQLNNDPSGSCTLDISPSLITLGESVTGTIYDGNNVECIVFGKQQGTDDWKMIYTGTTNQNGVLQDTFPIGVIGTFDIRAICGNCITNRDSLAVTDSACVDSDGDDIFTAGHVDALGTTYYDKCIDEDSVTEFICGDVSVVEGNSRDCNPGQICFETRSGGYCMDITDEGYEVGDDVGSGTSGSGSGGFGDDDSINVITMDWTTGGSFVLGAKITRSWNYVDPNCEPALPQQFPMEWSLYDSNGMAWQQYDYFPVSNVVDYVCPVTYHEDAPWKFVVKVGIQDCEVEYSWNVQPYVCEEN